MAQSQRLDIKQSQSLVMTADMQQAIQLLQFSHLEMMEFIQVEAEKNPFLEVEGALPSDQDFSSSTSASDSDFSSLDYKAMDLTLKQHVLQQINYLTLLPEERTICYALTSMLSDEGYIEGDLHELVLPEGMLFEDLEALLSTLQTLEPVGLFARNLRECLALQLKDLGEDTQETLDFLDDLIAKGGKDIPKTPEAQEALAIIRGLNPKPGLSFYQVSPTDVPPDVMVYRNARGDWVVELNPEIMPKLSFSHDTYATLKESLPKGEDRKFFHSCHQSAHWLMKAIEQRAKTILRVAQKVFRHQESFLEKGIEALRPLTLREIAEELEIHESTVSRVTSHKYAQTPWGVYELKYFFTSGVARLSSEEGVSSRAIQHKIKKLIDQEGQTPLSDEHLALILNREGICVARRTVAKYREALGIPSSPKRSKS